MERHCRDQLVEDPIDRNPRKIAVLSEKRGVSEFSVRRGDSLFENPLIWVSPKREDLKRNVDVEVISDG